MTSVSSRNFTGLLSRTLSANAICRNVPVEVSPVRMMAGILRPRLSWSFSVT